MSSIKKITLSAMFLAIGYILPLFTGQLSNIGNMLLPMHLPVFLCGLICGWQYGLAVGIILPISRSFIFSRPPLFPKGITMAFELAAYGFFCGFLYSRSKKTLPSLYKCILTAMILGRIVWGIVKWLIFANTGDAFTLMAFISGGFLEAIPGIILQLVLIPAIMISCKMIKRR